MKLVICTPTLTRPHDAYLSALEGSVSALDAAGIEHSTVYEIGSAYISHARAKMLHKAMAHGADTIMFIDHDVSWDAAALLKVLQTPDPVVCATYRFKKDEVEYMGNWHHDEQNRPIVRESDGAILANWMPAGFLKVTREFVLRFMKYYPELCYGPERDHIDLFNHGAHRGVWYGEDFAFSRNAQDMGSRVWLVPNVNVDHHHDAETFRGNLHRHLLDKFGSAAHPKPQPIVAATFQEQSAA